MAPIGQRSSDPVGAAVSGRCPACGQGALFAGWLEVRPSCLACQQSFAFADSGDGPAFFLTLGAGLFGMLTAGLLIAFGLPAGVILVLSVLVTSIALILAFRPAKGLMIGLQYKFDASEGRGS